jgi:large subunit ribosomal protein L10
MRTDQARDVERQRKDFPPATTLAAVGSSHTATMPPRIHLRPRALCPHALRPTTTPLARTAAAGYASVTATPAPAISRGARPAAPIVLYPPTQPPSHKPPEVRKTQLHRQYQSLLRSSPLMLIFQHNNVKADEWMGIRRELAIALRKLDAERTQAGHDAMSDEVRIQVIQTNIFASALKIVEFFNPEQDALDHAQHPTDARTPTSARVPLTGNKVDDERFTHGLSRHAYQVANNRKLKHDLEPLLAGPLAVVAFPSVSPQHLKAVLSILSPSAPDFPAPKRKVNPDYYEPAVQAGLQKLMLLGARVEGKVFDVAGTKWVGSIPGGIDGLRAQLVQMLQGVGGSLTGALEGASKSLYFTMESRRMDMEEKEKGPEEPKAE